MDNCVFLGKEKVHKFTESLPNGFYKIQAKQVKTTNIHIESIKVSEVEIIGPSLIYSRAATSKFPNYALKIKKVFKFELASFPTTMFEGSGSLRLPKSKSILNSLSANPTKWPNTLKQFVGKLPTNCLSVFGHFVNLTLKGLKLSYLRCPL